MDLYVFDRDLNFIGIVDTFSSLQWNRRYFKYGDFELQCPLTTDNLNLLAKGNIIWKQGDCEAGSINYRNLKQDTDGNEILIIKGNFLTSYLSRRIIWGTENISDTTENAMRILVNKHCINPIDSKRIIPNLILGDLKGYTSTVKYQVSYKNLADEIESLSSTNNLGYRVNFDIKNKKLVFEVYAGADRSVHQTDRSPCIFSKEFENVFEQEYTDSNDNLKTIALVGGMGEGSARKLTTVGSGTGLDRYELFIDAKDTSNQNADNTTMSDTDYNNLLTGKGITELAQYPETKSFDSKINFNSNLVYKNDFDLGDIITCVSKKWGITMDTRITEVQEVYEEQGFELNVTFGDALPTLIDKIKQKVR